MNDDSIPFEKTTEQWAAYQKIWADSFTRMMQAGFTVSPDSAPPEFLRQIRAGIFQALSKSWEEFLRSPEFLQGIKQWMETATGFRKMTNDFLTRAHHDAQSPAREDVDDILVSVRQIETRILDRLDEVAKDVEALKTAKTKPTASRRPAKRLNRRPASTPRKKH